MDEHIINNYTVISEIKMTRIDATKYVDMIKTNMNDSIYKEFTNINYTVSRNTMVSKIYHICKFNNINNNINYIINMAIHKLYDNLGRNIIMDDNNIYNKNINILYIDNSNINYILHSFTISVWYYHNEIYIISNEKNKNYFKNIYRYISKTY